MFQVISYVFGALVGIVIALSLYAWWKIIRRASRGIPIVPAFPRHEVPWRGNHVAVAFFVYLAAQMIARFAVHWRFEIPADEGLPIENIEVVVWSLATVLGLSVLASLLVITFLKIDLGASPIDLGWSRRFMIPDVLLGLLGFIVLGPAVYLLQDALVRLQKKISEDPQSHPFFDLVKENPTSQVFFWTAVAAIVVAPPVEEFLFRVVFQGWLEKLVRVARAARARNANGGNGDPALGNPHSPGTPNTNQDAASQGVTAADSPLFHPTVPPLTWMPILLSAFVFSLFHVGHGPAPVPLFLFAIGLGYLYQRTHRILPGIIMHMTLNTVSMVALWVTVNMPPEVN